MCGRFLQTLSPDEVAELFEFDERPRELPQRYNLAPSQQAAVVRNEGGRVLRMLRWGLVPAGAADPRIGNRLINARAETAGERPAFRAAFRSRRCLVPVNGYYEWSRRNGGRQPWLIRMRGRRPFALAGLWERFRARPRTGLFASPPDGPLETFTILTTAANRALAPIHDRMPVVVRPERFDAWLSGEDIPLGPFPADAMVAAAVSSRVNDPRNDDPRCIEPAPDSPSVARLF